MGLMEGDLNIEDVFPEYPWKYLSGYEGLQRGKEYLQHIRTVGSTEQWICKAEFRISIVQRGN